MKNLFARKQTAEPSATSSSATATVTGASSTSKANTAVASASTAVAQPARNNSSGANGAHGDDAGPSLAALVASGGGGGGGSKAEATAAATRGLGYGFHSTALQIKDAQKSLDFYQEALGMHVVKEIYAEEEGYSMYFLGFDDVHNRTRRRRGKLMRGASGDDIVATYDGVGEDDTAAPSTADTVFGMQRGLLQLIYVHGSESDPSFRVATGGPGFTHFSVSVPDVDAAKSRLESMGVTIVEDGSSARGFAAIADPDGYHIQLISQREGEDDSLRQQLEQLLSDPAASSNAHTQPATDHPSSPLQPRRGTEASIGVAATSGTTDNVNDATMSRLENALRIARGGSPVSPPPS